MTGKNLKELIDTLGISQRKLAEQMGVTPQTISAILTAKDVRSGTLERIAEAIGVKMSFFYPTEGGVSIAGNNNISGNNNAVGNVTIGDAAVLQERVTMLEKLLEEKERLIKVLMEK